MKTNETTGTENWTPRQWAAYEALKASMERYEREQLNRASILNKAPKGGWTDADRVPATK